MVVIETHWNTNNRVCC